MVKELCGCVVKMKEKVGGKEEVILVVVVVNEWGSGGGKVKEVEEGRL